ncbi:MAG: serine hydrolase domain-containing protein, partial [Gemmatimonadaceae bacterium]
MRTSPVLSAFWLLAALSPAHAQKKPPAQSLEGSIDPVVRQMMAEWHVPGIAVGVVKKGQIILAKGYGYRDVDKKLPVTSKTLMPIGSNTKSFTVVLLGQLVDQGKLAWDTPVQKYLPNFQLYDEYAGKSMTARDLVSHRSGL